MSKQSSSTPSLSISKERAHRILRNFFFRVVRPNSMKVVATRFLREVPTLEQARNMSLEELKEKQRTEAVIDAAGDLLSRIISLCNWNQGDKPLVTGTVNVRILLACYMIAAHPTETLEEVDSDLAKGVIEASTPFLEFIEAMAQSLASGSKWSDLPMRKDLPDRLLTYLRNFRAWKVVDEQKLASRLTHAIKGLQEAIQVVEQQPIHIRTSEVSLKKLQAYKAQITRLEAKLVQIAGHKAVDAAASAGTKRKAPEEATVPPRPARVEKASRGAPANGAEDAPAGTLGKEDGMTNEQLGHELLLDPNFSLVDHARTNPDKLTNAKVREVFEIAFWESLCDDLNMSPPLYTRVLSVLQEIRGALQGMVLARSNNNSQHPLYIHIAEIINIDLIKQRIQSAAFSYDDCIGLMGCIFAIIIPLFQPPPTTTAADASHIGPVQHRLAAQQQRISASVDRKAETVTKWNEALAAMRGADNQEARNKAFCQSLQLAMDRIHQVRVDGANRKLRSIAPVIKEHGITYEQNHFKSKLEQNKITLKATTEWIDKAVRRAIADERVKLADLREGSAAAFAHVLQVGMVDLIANPSEKVPETLLLDAFRIKVYRACFEKDVALAATLLSIASLAAKQLQPPKSPAALMVRVAKVAHRVVYEELKGTQQLREAVLREVAADLENAAAILDTNVAKKDGSPVYQLVTKHVRNFWIEVLRGVSNEAEIAAKLPEAVRGVMAASVAKTVAQLRHMFGINCRVHVDRYNKLIKECVSKIPDQ